MYEWMNVCIFVRVQICTLTYVPIKAGKPHIMANSQIDKAMAMVIRVARLPPPAEKK